jgi:DegV family protein with EDD domain
MIQIVTDSGADLSEDQKKGLPIHFAPLRITLGDKHYDEMNAITPAQFFEELKVTSDYPITSQPTVGDFERIYREIAKTGQKILSIHISSGLSGTLNTAKLAAQNVPEADVTFWDSKTLSAALGWQVQAAAIAATKNWPMEKILERLEIIRDQIDGFFTLKEMRYLVHGGRISHIKGLMAQVLNIKPIIFVEKVKGIYQSAGQAISLKNAINQIVSMNVEKFADAKVRVQLVHGSNMDSNEMLRSKIQEKMNVFFEDVVPVAPVLGAHTGPTLVGIVIGPMAVFSNLI